MSYKPTAADFADVGKAQGYRPTRADFRKASQVSLLHRIAHSARIADINNLGGGVAEGLASIPQGALQLAGGPKFRGTDAPFYHPHTMMGEAGRFIGGVAGAGAGVGALEASLGGLSGISQFAPMMTGQAGIGASMMPNRPLLGATLGAGGEAVARGVGKAGGWLLDTSPGKYATHMMTTAKSTAKEGLEDLRNKAKEIFTDQLSEPHDISELETQVAKRHQNILNNLTANEPLATALKNNPKDITNELLRAHKEATTESENNYDGVFKALDLMGQGNSLDPSTFSGHVGNLTANPQVPNDLKNAISDLVSPKRTVSEMLSTPTGGKSINAAQKVQSLLGFYGSKAASATDPLTTASGKQLLAARAALKDDISQHAASHGLGDAFERATAFHRDHVVPFQNKFADVLYKKQTPENIAARFANPDNETKQVVENSSPELHRLLLLNRIGRGVGTVAGSTPEGFLKSVNAPGTLRGYNYLLDTPIGHSLNHDISELHDSKSQVDNLVNSNKILTEGQTGIEKEIAKINKEPSAAALAKRLARSGIEITPSNGKAVVAEALAKSRTARGADPAKIVSSLNALYGKGLGKYVEASGMQPMADILAKKLGMRRTLAGVAGAGLGVLSGSRPLEMWSALRGGPIGEAALKQLPRTLKASRVRKIGAGVLTAQSMEDRKP